MAGIGIPACAVCKVEIHEYITAMALPRSWITPSLHFGAGGGTIAVMAELRLVLYIAA